MLDHPLMAVVDRASRAVGAMRLGRVVERPAIFGNPQHPCIKQLLAAVPVADPRRRTTEEDRNCRPILSPAFPVDHEPVPSVHDDVRPGHLVLKHDLGRFKHG